jgi:acetyl-CoA acyltransferase
LATLQTCSLEFALRNNLRPLAKVRTAAVAACPPRLMGIGPIAATRKALARTRQAASDLDVIELNEAFASQAIVCIHEIGLDEARLNLDGGGLAIHWVRPAPGRSAGDRVTAARGRPVRAGNPMHRRRVGHRDDSTGAMTWTSAS